MVRKIRLGLDQVKNEDCITGCTQQQRLEMTEDNICKRVKSHIDGLEVRCVGEWAYDKIFYLVQYFGIFAGGMKYKWRGLNYIEIGTGPGRCILREVGNEVDGTALAIIKHKSFREIKSALFIDNDPLATKALKTRISNYPEVAGKARCEIADYTDSVAIGKLLSSLDSSCLSLVFIDPTECNVPFQTVKTVGDTLKNADLIINVAMGTDISRNIKTVVLNPSFQRARQKYSAFLDEPDFFQREDVKEFANADKDKELRRAFLETYKAKLVQCGYRYIDVKRIDHYYNLLFASKEEKGLEFWRKICKIGPDNQRQLL